MQINDSIQAQRVYVSQQTSEGIKKTEQKPADEVLISQEALDLAASDLQTPTQGVVNPTTEPYP